MSNIIYEYEKKCPDIAFLALTIWREARGEGYRGMFAVAHAILNRVARPSWWGNDVMSVIFKKWQFSSLTDPKDKQLIKWPKSTDTSWWDALEISNRCITEETKSPVPGADSYYDISIPPPYWATDDTFVEQIDKLRFYNLDKDIEISDHVEFKK